MPTPCSIPASGIARCCTRLEMGQQLAAGRGRVLAAFCEPVPAMRTRTRKILSKRIRLPHMAGDAPRLDTLQGWRASLHQSSRQQAVCLEALLKMRECSSCSGAW